MKRFSEWSGEGATAAAPPSGFPAFSAKLLGAGADSRRENKVFLISFRFQPRGTGTSSLHTPAPRSSAERSYVTNFISFVFHPARSKVPLALAIRQLCVIASDQMAAACPRLPAGLLEL